MSGPSSINSNAVSSGDSIDKNLELQALDLQKNGDAHFATLQFFEKMCEKVGSDQPPEEVAKKVGEALKNAKEIGSWSDFAKICQTALKEKSPDSLYAFFLGEFSDRLGLELDESGHLGEKGDWAPLAKVRSKIDFSRPETANNPFTTAFEAFLEKYQNSPHSQKVDQEKGSAVEIAQSFLNRLDSFLFGFGKGAIPLHKESNIPNKLPGNDSSYEGIYQALTKNPTKHDFEKKLVAYYDKEIEGNGYFTPTQSFLGWVQERKDEFTASSLKTPSTTNQVSEVEATDDPNAATPTHFSIMSVIAALLSMTNTLQELAVVQSSQLQTYAEIQGAYTTLEGQVPFFKQDGNDLWGKEGDDDAASFRNELNSTFTQPTISNLQAERGIYEDASKTIQNNMSSTVKEVESNMDIVQKLLDMLNSITSQMFR